MLLELKLSREGKFLLNQIMDSNLFRMIVNSDGTSKHSINRVKEYISKGVSLLVEVDVGDYVFDKRRDAFRNEIVYDVSQIVDINTDIIPTAELKHIATIKVSEITTYLALLRKNAKMQENNKIGI